MSKIAITTAIALTTLILWPLVSSINTSSVSADDGLLIGWLINHATEALLGKVGLFQPPFFHPYLDTLAYSDPYLSTGFFNIPFRLMTENIVLMHNLHLVLGTIAGFLSMYILAMHLFKDRLAALAAAFYFTFSLLHFEFIFHLHTYLVAGLPLAVYFFLKYLERGQARHLAGLAAAFLYQALNAPMTAYFLAAILLLLLPFKQKYHLKKLLTDKKVLLTAAVLLAVLVAFYFPYWRVSEHFEYTRSIRDAAHFSFPVSRLWQADLLFSFAMLGLLAIIPRKTKKSGQKISPKILAAIAATGMILMLGPVLKNNGETIKLFGLPIPLPYALFYYVVPGIQAFRGVSRWAAVLNFGLALLMAHGLAKTRLKRQFKVLWLAVLMIVIGTLSRRSLQIYEIPPAPPIYEQVKAHPGKILAEFPMYLWDMGTDFVANEDRRLIYQAQHDKKLYNGISGFMPEERVADIHLHYKLFPQPESLEVLKSAGVDLVLIHFAEYEDLENSGAELGNYPTRSTSEIREMTSESKQLKEIICSNQDCLYELN